MGHGRISVVRMDDGGVVVPAHCKVSFIVPAFSAMRTLPSSIRSIREAAPPGSEIIIVVDGGLGALDDTARLADDLADKVVHRPCQGGAARSRNDGARVASGDILIFVDSDVTVNPEAVAGAVARIDEGADAVFGAYEPLPPLAVRNLATTYKNLLHHYTHLHGATDASTFWSGFGAVRRDAFWEVGGFDPSVTTTADVEDIHLGYRLRAAGRKIVLDPSLQVQHHKHYTFRGVIASDVVHRAIPWTRAMLECKVVKPDMNLRRSAVVAALVASAIPAALVGALLFGPGGFLLAASLLAMWLGLNFAFLSYAYHHGGLKLATYCAALIYLYHLYCPPGVALGVASYLLHRREQARVNWLHLDPVAASPETAVSVAVIADADEHMHPLVGLPPGSPWWELIVVSPVERHDLPAGARFILAPVGATRNAMRQRALEASRGEMLAFLDADCIPDEGWLDHVRAAAAGPHIVEGGSFHDDRRGASRRAAQVSRYWNWRPERRAAWMTDHPLTNLAVRRDVAILLGGFRDDGALLQRMAWFGARPVCFNPAMAVQLRSATACASFIRDAGGIGRLRSAAESRYLDLHRGTRVVMAVLAPVVAGARLIRIVTTVAREGNASRSLLLAMPLVAAAEASGVVGTWLGLLRPRARGGLVARDENDLGLLGREGAFSTTVGTSPHSRSDSSQPSVAAPVL